MKKSPPKSKFEKSELSRTLSVLNKLGQSLTDVQKLSKVLRQIAKDARNILGADMVDLYEYKQTEKEFVLPPVMVGARRNPHIPKDEVFNDDVVVKVVRAGKPEYFPDAQKAKLLTARFEVKRPDAPDERFVIREGIVSSVALPLMAGEETVGVMFVNYRTSQTFDNEQNNLIESFSKLAAIAIHNARLWEAQNEQSKLREEEFTERSRQLNAINEIVNAIGSTFDPLPAILNQVVGLFSAEYGAIGLFNSRTQEIQFYAIWEEGTLLTGEYIPADKRSISGKKSIMRHVAITGRSYRVSDIKKDSHYRKWYPETQSELAVPLKDSHDTVIGVLNLEDTSLAAFSQSDEDLCQGLANVISSVIEKSNLLTTTQTLHRQLELLHSVVGEQDMPRVLTLILSGLNEIVGYGTSSSINLYDDANDSFYNIMAIGKLEENLRIEPRPKGTCRYVLQTRTSLYVDDTKYDLDNPPNRPTLRQEAVKEAGIKSFAALPLIRNDRVLGVLFVHQTNPTRFTQDLQLVLETFASQATIAIDNARRQVDITAINEAIVSKQPLEEILRLIVTKAAQTLGVEYGSLWYEDPASGDLLLGALYCPSGKLVPGYSTRLLANAPSINMEVCQTGKPRLLKNVKEATERYHRIYHPAQTELAVPMIYRDRTIGTLNVESDKLGILSDFDVRILEAFSSQAAIAIMSAQTNEQRIKLIDAVGKMNSTFGTGRLSDIYNLIAQKAQELAVATYCTLWILDEKNDCIKVGAVSGREALENVLPLNDKSINGYVAMTRRPYLCKDTIKDPYYHPWYPDIRSNFTVPLLFGSELIGTLHVESVKSNAYLEYQQESLQLLGNHAANAIKSALFFDEITKASEMRKELVADLDRKNIRLERRNASFESLTEIGQQLTANVQRGEQEILSIIQQQASRIMDTGNMFIALYEPELDEVHFELAFIDGIPVDIQNEPNWAPRSGGNGRTEWIIRNKAPKLTYTKKEAEEWYRQPNAQNYIGQTFASWLGVPIMFGDEVLGVIATYHKDEEYKYDPDDLIILSLMGRQAAIALQNARLIGRLDTMRELGEDLSSSLSI